MVTFSTSRCSGDVESFIQKPQNVDPCLHEGHVIVCQGLFSSPSPLKNFASTCLHGERGSTNGRLGRSGRVQRDCLYNIVAVRTLFKSLSHCQISYDDDLSNRKLESLSLQGMKHFAHVSLIMFTLEGDFKFDDR